MPHKLCHGRASILANNLINKQSKKILREFTPNYWDFRIPRPEGIKRIKMVCPKCKRRLTPSVSTCEDGCCLYFTIPPHKPKKWWKKNKAKWNTK